MKIVAIEGITNAGKSTLCRNLATALSARGLSVHQLSTDLRNDLVYNSIRSITHPVEHTGSIDYFSELFLYAAQLSRKSSLIEKIRISRTDFILVDRYALSLSCFFKSVRRLPAAIVDAVIVSAVREVRPDIEIILDCSSNAIVKRSAEQPLSRKDHGIEEYAATLRSALRTAPVNQGDRCLLMDTTDMEESAVLKKAERFILS